jgi:proline iminopeptidase
VDTAEFALDRLLDDIERARQELGLGRVAVLGHSGHALMALEYAKKYPAHVSHVIMIGMAPDLSAASAAAADLYWQESVSPDRKAVLEENFQRLPDERLAQLPPDEQFIRTYVRNGPRIWYDPRFDSSPLWEGVEVNRDMIDHVWGCVFRKIDITNGLATFDRPVFLALGRYDFLVAPPAAWDAMRSQFRDLTVRVFERSGHTPQYEEATLFDAELVGVGVGAGTHQEFTGTPAAHRSSAGREQRVYVPVQDPPGQSTIVIKAGTQAALVQKQLQQFVLYTIERE